MNINSFKNEESDKKSVDSTHIQGACGGELMGSPVVSGSHSLTIDVAYVFVSQTLSLTLSSQTLSLPNKSSSLSSSFVR